MTTDEGVVVGEQDFHVISEEELKKLSGKNLKEDLINMGFLDYDKLPPETKKAFDELEKETRDIE